MVASQTTVQLLDKGGTRKQTHREEGYPSSRRVWILITLLMSSSGRKEDEQQENSYARSSPEQNLREISRLRR